MRLATSCCALVLALCVVACDGEAKSGPAKNGTVNEAAPAKPVEDIKAEYAFRWFAMKNGNEIRDAVVDALRSAHGLAIKEQPQTWPVQYFSVDQPTGLPPGYEATLRLRNGSEFTYKIRGDAPAPKELPMPGCPDTAKIESEWDIAADAHGKPLRTKASSTCEGEGVGTNPGELSVGKQPRPCEITMERSRLAWPGHKDVKVELWSFKSTAGARELVEVSWKGKVKPADEKAFAGLIAAIPADRAGPAAPGKEETAKRCDSGSWD